MTSVKEKDTSTSNFEQFFNYYLFDNKTGKVLDAGSNLKQGDKLSLGIFSNSITQRWNIREVGSNTPKQWEILNPSTGLAIGISSQTTKDNIPIELNQRTRRMYSNMDVYTCLF